MRPKIKQRDIFAEYQVCPYCMKQQNDPHGSCCSETSAHFADAYEMNDGDVFLASEVDVEPEPAAPQLMPDPVFNRIVEVSLRSEYGRERTYPENPTARLLAQLSGKKTFTEADLAIICNLGYTVERKRS